MADKLDFKKEYKDLYFPGKEPALLTVPPMTFLMVDGAGAPEGESYQTAIPLFYTVAFTIKMSKLGPWQPEGYVDYTVPPLEGLWEGAGKTLPADRNSWKWTSLMRVPDYVTPEVFAWAVGEASRKKPGPDYSRIRLERYEEGLCAQVMHVGPYAEEQGTLDRLDAFVKREGLIDRTPEGRLHHEIYLGDPRRTVPERLKTVLRHPVRRK